MPASIESATYDEQGLITSDLTLVSQPVTIEAGADLVRGAVLGRITANGKYVLSATAAGDGSETAVAVLAEDAAAAAADVTAPAYFTGAFADDLVTYGTGHTATTAEADFRAAGAPLFLQPRHPK